MPDIMIHIFVDCVFYLAFRLFFMDKTIFMIIEDIKLRGAYKDGMENKLKKDIDLVFILWVVLVSIGSRINPWLARYIDIIPMLVLFCKIVKIWK